MVLNFGCGSRYTYHFVDAFTTFVLSCATLFMDVEFSTLPVEQGHKKRHCKLDNLSQFEGKYIEVSFNVKTFLKQSIFHDNPKMFLFLLQNFVLNCHVASIFLKSPLLGKLRFPISCCQMGFRVLKRCKTKSFPVCLKTVFSMFFHAKLYLTTQVCKLYFAL